AVFLAQMFQARLHERGRTRVVRVPPDHVRTEPGLHARQRNDEKASAIKQGLPHDARNAQHPRSPRLLLLQAARSAAITAAVSGRTPRHRKKESAACSTSMPKPSEVVAPDERAIVRKAVSRP